MMTARFVSDLFGITEIMFSRVAARFKSRYRLLINDTLDKKICRRSLKMLTFSNRQTCSDTEVMI